MNDMSLHSSLVLTLTLCLFTEREATAQELTISEPLRGAPSLALVREASPAIWEFVYFGAAGAARELAKGSEWVPALSVGAELTTQFLAYDGFPANPYRRGAELRIGPWAEGTLRSKHGLLEGGLVLQMGGIFHASWGTWALRLGGGYGAFASGQSPHWGMTFTYGICSSTKRYSQRGRSQLQAEPKPWGLAAVARLFVTYREAFRMQDVQEMVFGIELSPNFLFPPYEAYRLLGGPPKVVPWSGTSH